ncbi:unnamed protein product, partial [Ixodes pacificus]
SSPELLRPSPNHSPSRPPLRPSEAYAFNPIQTPSPDTPPRPPTPGRWALSRSSTSPPLLPTPPPRHPLSPDSSPPTLRPPTPGAFLLPPTSCTTLTRPSTPRSPDVSVCLPSVTHPPSETSPKLLYTCSKPLGTPNTLGDEKSQSSNSWSATCNYGTAVASGSLTGTNCASLTGYDSFTTSRSPGGEPPWRATPTPLHPSSLDLWSPLGGRRNTWK